MSKRTARRDKVVDRLVAHIVAAAHARFGARARFDVWVDTSDGDPDEFDACLRRVPLRSGPDNALFPRDGGVFTATSKASALLQLLDAINDRSVR